MKRLKKVTDLRKPVSEDEAQHGNFFFCRVHRVEHSKNLWRQERVGFGRKFSSSSPVGSYGKVPMGKNFPIRGVNRLQRSSIWPHTAQGVMGRIKETLRRLAACIQASLHPWAITSRVFCLSRHSVEMWGVYRNEPFYLTLFEGVCSTAGVPFGHPFLGVSPEAVPRIWRNVCSPVI